MLLFSNCTRTKYKANIVACVFMKVLGLLCFAPPPPPKLSGLISFTPPGARAIFLHSNVLHNNI